MKRQMRTQLLAVGATAAAAGLMVSVLPHAFWPKCPIYWATGIYCPGCGGLRAANELMHGDIIGALNQNALIFAIPIFVALGFLAQKAKKPTTNYWVIGIVAVIALAFTVLRNLPGSWLAPDAIVG